MQESCTKKVQFCTRRRKSHFFLTHPVYVIGRDRDREIGRDIWLGKGYKMV